MNQTNHTYSFNNMCRLGDDTCYVTARTMQNNSMGSYITTNYFTNTFNRYTNKRIAMNQPCVFINDGYGVAGGDTIDVDSELRINQTSTIPLHKLNLVQRQFLTVPYLGKGHFLPRLESQLQQGDANNTLKSTKTIMDKPFNNANRTPLIESIKNTIQNPIHRIEESAIPGWVRGGIPTRDLTRRRNHLEGTNGTHENMFNMCAN
jgi:hypothetical protein